MSLKKILLREVTSAEEDFYYEIDSAKKLLSGEEKIENLEYYNDYLRSLKKESPFINQPCLFVGFGAVPFSIYILNKKLNIKRVDGLDISKQATDIAKEVLKHYGIKSNLFVKPAERFNSYNKYDTVVLALEVGVSHGDKKKIFSHIQQVQPQSTFIIRSSNTSDFVNVEKYIQDYFIIKEKIDIFGGLSTSYVCKVKGAE